ncbi:P-loop containing nucleoside triphosphate hydrolase protein [Sistotremastrum suecicum HHB10207 ss-3]|uniref:p-loop containing nucleoside triphosphate hydrolase protein n=1 Tax=Sistotremastrum suecicum HHB10207 ss-3 TaxID=1314776 RepID=A0A165Z7J6_9AGAM|nr:P-loop containing nucleoside triphosphate hydrolase protein [Sistotremastrum suecicum HHB10207 ss-3]
MDFQSIASYIPPISACFSFVILATQFCIALRRVKPSSTSVLEQDFDYGPEYAQSVRRSKILQRVRFVLCLVLVVLSVSLLALDRNPNGLDRVEIFFSTFFIYTSLLSLLTFFPSTASHNWSSTASIHLTSLHAIAFLTLTSIDISPLAYTHPPSSPSTHLSIVDWLKYTRVTLLFLSGALIPVLLPRRYVPLDPSNPHPPALHQISSYFSFAYFTFLDPLVWKAFKNENKNGNGKEGEKGGFGWEDIPRLAEDDKTEYLSKHSFHVLDPVMSGRKRNFSWSLIILFSTSNPHSSPPPTNVAFVHSEKQYLIMTAVTLLQATTDFAWPLATNRILAYLESPPSPQNRTETQESNIRPWVWILWLTIGPIFGTLLNEIYLYYQTVVFAKTQALITQLLLVHSLRVRLNTTNASNSTSTSSHSDDVPSTEVPETDTKKASDEKEDYIGKINNLMTGDVDLLITFQEWMRPLILVIHAMMCMLILYFILGWSALVGLATMLLCLPIPGYLGTRILIVQEGRMKKADSRIAAVTQMMNVIRMVKLFAWERKVEGRIYDKRQEELREIFRNVVLDCISIMANVFIPMATKVVTYAVYTLVMGEDLIASKVFSSLVLFNILDHDMHTMFWIITGILRGKVSLDRVGEFLNSGELLDSNLPVVSATDRGITTPTTTTTTTTPIPNPRSHRKFTLRIPHTLSFPPSSKTLIYGPTASGKTSLLMALLGEMYFSPSAPGGYYRLPRNGDGGGVAYAAQETWVLNDTIRENILFGAAYDEERFERVIWETGLRQDLDGFEGGDMTEVGERGITLSGGQKARITLARALYSRASVLLLDDVLSALDVHTAQWVARNCLGGELIKGRTILLVTNNVALCEPFANYVVGIEEGVVGRLRTVREAMKGGLGKESREALKETERKEEGVIDKPSDGLSKGDEAENLKKSDGKLIVAEEMPEGHLSWAAARLWFVHLGGPLFFTLVAIMLLLQSVFGLGGNWFLGWWSSQYVDPPSGGVPSGLYLGIYTIIAVLDISILIVNFAYFEIGGIRASRSLHQNLIKSVLSATLRWLDTVPISRVIARCAQDFQIIDGVLPNNAFIVFWESTRLTTYFITIVVSAGYVTLVPGVIVIALGLTFGQIYIKAQLPLKRMRSNARSPVLSHVGAALHGLVSIRAYGAQESVLKESFARIDLYTHVSRTYMNLNRWIGIRTKTLGSLFTGAVAAYLVYGRDLSSGRVGFTLSLIAAWTDMLLSWIREFNDLEVQGNSIERIKDFLDIDHEPEPTEEGKVAAYWPASGELRVENLSARYSADGPVVLKNISFSLKSGQRMGIVGRTGAGKSSMALALLRAIPTTGNVLYDGIDTSKINLDILRSNITIIPQHPELLVGNIRENLDPFGEHEDVTLNDALRAAGLYSIQGDDSDGKIGLDTDVSNGGSNFSQGQRQILALARAILRGSKIVILDEATAAIDHQTDHAIQESLRTEFKDATVITVAHRLQTIMNSDKIMVLDKGEVVEFDSPSALLCRNGGFFKSLVNESPDREELIRAARVSLLT